MKSVLVTGASRGIGLEFVRQLAGRALPPEHIFASCRSPDKAAELQKLAASHENVKVLLIDVQREETYGEALETVTRLVGKEGLNVLINNAGIYSQDSYETVSRKLLTDIMDINVISPIRLTQAFLPLLRKAAKNSPVKRMCAERAAIFNISSGYGSITENTGGSNAGYRESKAALNMFSKSMSISLKEDKILVSSVCPGWVQTDMGGRFATRTTHASVSSLLEIFSQLSEEHNGLFFYNRVPLQTMQF